jgi:hypothetical protein
MKGTYAKSKNVRVLARPAIFVTGLRSRSRGGAHSVMHRVRPEHSKNNYKQPRVIGAYRYCMV